jgi:chromosome segregation ATPase
VSNRTASAGAQAAAHKLGAQLALDLLEYDPQLKAAMAYVFGNSFVCKVCCCSLSRSQHGTLWPE